MKSFAIHRGQRINYFLGVLIALDQFAGALFPGADIDETISSRIGRKKLRRGGKLSKTREPLLYLLDKILDRIDRNHSINSIGA